MTTGIKHRLLGLSACVWDGHEPTIGVVYSPVKGKHVVCVCCVRCHKIL